MKQTHTRREKGRAVFLVALMVLSVFAMSASFAGAAAANATEVQVDDVDLADEDSVDAVVTHDETDEEVAIALINDADGTVEFDTHAETEEGGSTTFTLDVNSVGNYTVYAEAGATGSTDSSTLDDSNAEASGSFEVTNSAIAVTELENEDDFYQGQEFRVTGFGDGETVELYQGTSTDGEPVDYIRANSVGTVDIDTSDLDENPYLLHTDSEDGSFWVVEQDVDVEFADDSVAQTNTDLTYESENRDEAVDLEISSEQLDGDDLEDVFEVDDSDDGVVTVEDVEEGGSINADFSDVETGEYDFTVSVADTTAESDASIEVTEGGEPNAEFDQSTYSEEAGDIVEFTVELENVDSDSAQVEMIEEDDNYNPTLEVTDEDGDGEVTVYFNTYLAGDDNDAAFYTDEDSDDTVEIVDENEDYDDTEDSSLLPADFDLELYVGEGDDREETDVAALFLTEGWIDSATTGVAPSDADLEEIEDITDATTESDEVAEDDNLVFAFEASGVFGAIEEGEFEEHFDLMLEQTNDQYNDGQSLDNYDGDYDIVEDPENDRFFIVLNTDEMEEGDEYELTLEPATDGDDITSLYFVDDEEYKKGSDVIVSTQFSVVERMIEVTGDFDKNDRLLVPNGEEATVTGESNAAPGTDVQVRLRATGEDPFLETQTVQVNEDGTIDAEFDLSDYDADQEFTVRMTDRNADDLQHQVDAILTESGSAPHSVTVTVEDADGNAVSGAEISADDESATTDDDGKATLELHHGDYKITASYDGEDASGKLTVDDDTPDEVTLTLGEEDVDLNPDDEKDDDNDNNDNNDNDNNDDNDGDDNNDDQPGSGADDDQPGFGIIVALIALLAAAGFALRRQ